MKKIYAAAFSAALAVCLSGCAAFDKEAPVIDCKSEITVRYDYCKGFDESVLLNGVSAEDNVDGSVEVSASVGKTVDGPGRYTVTYTASDKKGNTATETAVLDVVEPVIGKWENENISFDFSEDHVCYMKLGSTDAEWDWSKCSSRLDEVKDLMDASVLYKVSGSVEGYWLLGISNDNINSGQFILYADGSVAGPSSVKFKE